MLDSTVSYRKHILSHSWTADFRLLFNTQSYKTSCQKPTWEHCVSARRGWIIVFAQVSTESEDDDGVDSQNVAHMFLDHKVLNSKPAHEKKNKQIWGQKQSKTYIKTTKRTLNTVSVTNHTITSKSRMHRETVAAFVDDTDLISSTTVKLRSVAMVVHVA